METYTSVSAGPADPPPDVGRGGVGEVGAELRGPAQHGLRGEVLADLGGGGEPGAGAQVGDERPVRLPVPAHQRSAPRPRAPATIRTARMSATRIGATGSAHPSGAV